MEIDERAIVYACPCGKPLVPAWEHKTGTKPLYWHAATDRGFCGPDCMIRWHHWFWIPWCEHTDRPIWIPGEEAKHE